MMGERERWWVIEEEEFSTALERVSAGDNPQVVLMEFVANSDGETVTQGEAPTCAECGSVVFWACSGCGETANNDRRIIADRDAWIEQLTHDLSAHILAVPSLLRGPYLRRAVRLRNRLYPQGTATEALS